MYHVKFIYMTNKYVVLIGDYMVNVPCPPSPQLDSLKSLLLYFVQLHVESGSDDLDILGHFFDMCVLLYAYIQLYNRYYLCYNTTAIFIHNYSLPWDLLLDDKPIYMHTVYIHKDTSILYIRIYPYPFNCATHAQLIYLKTLKTI